jgi:cyclomaltodextrin glucanotransferase
MAMALLLTSRGIPCLYYGCEQYLHCDNDNGNDPYNRPMMERWGETPASRILQTLCRLRRENPAIRWGGQGPKIVTNDCYAYVRRYRDSRCLVLLNRGGPRQLRVQDCELPDGNYRCELTGNALHVRGGEILFELHGHDMFVISLPGEAIVARSVAHVQLNGVVASSSERVALIGEPPELGEWDVRHARPLERINDNTWFGQIGFDASVDKEVAYKYVVLPHKGARAPRWENCTTRRRRVVDGHVVKWRDVWEE